MLASVLLGAALGGTPAGASVSLQRTDVPLPGAPDSVALGDLDGQNGKDIAIALPGLGSVGVMLNNGNGTFAAMKQYTGGPKCAGAAVDVTLGDVTQPAPGDRLVPDGKLDAYLACTPYVVRLTGDGAGALGNPEAINLGLPQYLGSATLDFLALTHRPDGNPVPLLVLQHAVGQFGRQLCMSYELDGTKLVCNPTPVQGPLAVGDLNGTQPGVPPDEIVTSEGGNKMGVFGWAMIPPLVWSDGVRTVPGDPAGPESATVGDLDNDGDLDVLVGQSVNSLSARVQSIHYFKWDASANPGGLEQVATPLPSTPGLDAVAIADIDGDGCNDVVGAGDYGLGMVHLGLGAGTFDGGRDLPQLGYQNPATATRVTLAADDLTGDGRPELVITDALAQYVMVYLNNSTPAGGACFTPPPPPAAGAGSAVVQATVTGTGAGVAPPGPSPPPAVPRTCQQPGTVLFTVGTPGDDVLVGDAGRNVLSGRGGDDCLFGRAGDDRVSGGTGDDLVRGASGDDRVNGNAGKDRLDGANGNDTISPGAGKDKVTAGGGNDKISARDGARDTIDCGAGSDSVTADRNDTVNSNCERVKRG